MNNCIFIGTLATEPEQKMSTAGEKYYVFQLAVKRAFSKSKLCDFFETVAYKHNGDFIGRNFHKGMRIGIRGQVQNYVYVNREGRKCKRTQINVLEVDFVHDDDFVYKPKEETKSNVNLDIEFDTIEDFNEEE